MGRELLLRVLHYTHLHSIQLPVFQFQRGYSTTVSFLTRRTSPEQIYAEQKSFFKRFINLSTLLGVLLIGMLGIKLADFLSWGLHLSRPHPLAPNGSH